MFDNLFGHFGPFWSAALLLGLVLLLFAVAAGETVRLILAGHPRPSWPTSLGIARLRERLFTRGSATAGALARQVCSRLPARRRRDG
ncbi:MAG: hypothetical protein OZ921_04085 [Sorangiineae bacterium]|nr:hypothetical protein [Polyangiaceae bacterium]MEB2321668.1 hypothetical protein [Sorangiineae bacterium]